MLLFHCLDGSGTNRTHLFDRCLGIEAQLDHEPSSNCSSSTNATPAMNEDIAAAEQYRPQARTCRGPCLLEFGIGNGNVDDEGVEPLHVPVDDPLTKVSDLKVFKLELLDEGQNRSCVPSHNGIKVKV